MKTSSLITAVCLISSLVFATDEFAHKQKTVILSMVVKNEADRYLKELLLEVRQYIDGAVLIDDGCTDNTIPLCRELLHGIPLKIVNSHAPATWESNEASLRRQQWEETISLNPDWILNLDADEIPEKKLRSAIKELIENDTVDAYGFRLYDFWDQEHYRSDQYWCAHLHNSFPALVRYRKDVVYTWSTKNLHCGRWPQNVAAFKRQGTPLRIKHFGWAKQEDRLAKYNRYMRLDPDGKWGVLAQYQSILDPNPHLVEWIEE